MDEKYLENRLENISRGDEDAFKELYETTYQRIFRYLYRLTKNQQMAEDIMIDTYTEIWRSARKYRGQSKVSKGNSSRRYIRDMDKQNERREKNFTIISDLLLTMSGYVDSRTVYVDLANTT